jgi:hypothetical protein
MEKRPYLFALRGLLIARLVVDLEPIEERRLRWIQTVRLDLLLEPLAPLRIIIRAGSFDFIAPGFHFFRRFLFAVAIKPFRHLFVTGALLHFRFEVVAFHAFEAKEHVVERAIEMVFANVPGDEGATFIERPSQNCVAANAHPRTAWWFLR